jgi:hypothetical protein
LRYRGVPTSKKTVKQEITLYFKRYHRINFQEILYMKIIRKSVEKFQVLFKMCTNKGYFTWRSTYIFFIIPRSILHRMRKYFRQKL